MYRHNERDELYDRVADPDETVNLLATDRKSDPDISLTVSELRDSLLEWLVETSDVIPWVADQRNPQIHQGWRENT